jgi:hypothetical protein
MTAAAVAAMALLGFARTQTSVPQTASADDPIRTLVGRLDLERYKAEIKALTKFGDRRQGTDRNRAATDWIEARLKSHGCDEIGRIPYEHRPAPRPAAGAAQARGGRSDGNPPKGFRGPTGVNNDPTKQLDLKLRELNSEPTTPGSREEVYATKIGAAHPEEMYIVGAHMDGLGYAEGANDNASGVALVMEIARILSSPDVETERSIRFVFWNNEETGLNGARAYVEQRRELQGKEDPPGSGRYPEPKWLGMIQHDMMLFDHGMPRPDGTLPPEQRPEADVNVEFAGASKLAAESQALAWIFRAANERYATDYPVTVGNRMSNTDSAAFQDHCPSISLRELERGSQIGSGWDPHWHQVTDMFANFSDKDFRLGLNAAQTTLAAVAELAGAKMRR